MQVDVGEFWCLDIADEIPFEPRDEPALKARAEIRRALGEMSAKAGEVLQGIFEGGPRWRTDLDNALLYNIGGRIGAAARHGVLLERRHRADGQGGVRYRFRVIERSQLPEHLAGRPIAELDVALSGPPKRPPRPERQAPLLPIKGGGGS